MDNAFVFPVYLYIYVQTLCTCLKCSLMIKIMVMIMIIFIHKKDTLQIIVTNKQQSPNLRMAVESYKKLIRLIINLKAIIILILQI